MRGVARNLCFNKRKDYLALQTDLDSRQPRFPVRRSPCTARASVIQPTTACPILRQYATIMLRAAASNSDGCRSSKAMLRHNPDPIAKTVTRWARSKGTHSRFRRCACRCPALASRVIAPRARGHRHKTRACPNAVSPRRPTAGSRGALWGGWAPTPSADRGRFPDPTRSPRFPGCAQRAKAVLEGHRPMKPLRMQTRP